MTKVYSLNKGMALLNIHTFPDPILRKKALPVKDFDQNLNDTAQSMLETMYASSGIGLAAIQAGVLKQIIVILRLKLEIQYISPILLMILILI